MSKFTDYYQNLNPEIKEYFQILSPVFPRFLIPFIETDTMIRLKDIGYFCGMDYGNQEIYDFKFYLSTLDHSISTALMVWGRTFNEKMTLAALFHDSGSPTTRHVIDYYNKDHIKQESTEIDLEKFLTKDKELMRLLKLYNYNLKDLANFKNMPLIDNKRPKLCADRLDGIFLTSLVWAQNTNITEIKRLYENIIIEKNEKNIDEFSFIDICDADRLVELNEIIDNLTHSDEDYFSMTYLAEIIDILIKKALIKYEDLFTLTDKELFAIIKKSLDIKDVASLYQKFLSLETNSNITRFIIKKRNIDPLILQVRYSSF